MNKEKEEKIQERIQLALTITKKAWKGAELSGINMMAYKESPMTVAFALVAIKVFEALSDEDT